MAFAVPFPGTTEAGTNEHWIVAGKFEQLNCTGLVTAPETAVTPTSIAPASPAVTVVVSGDAEIVSVVGAGGGGGGPPQDGVYATALDIRFFTLGLPVACTYNV